VSETDIFHKHYVTALCCIDRVSDKRKILLSGDAGGELSMCEISYNAITAKLERVEPIFKRRAHTGQISKIAKFSSDDIVVTASYDGSMIFWDIERDQKLMQLSEHDEPITSMHFMDDYHYLCSATKHDLIVWNVSIEEKESDEAKKDKSPEEESQHETPENRYSLKAKITQSMNFDEKGNTFSNCKLYGTNLKNDLLLFVSVGSDIKMLNILKGKYIGDIDGAHFKGTSNFGMILNSGLNSRLKTTLSKISQAVENGNQKEVLQLFVEQLNDYMLLSCSSKDKLRVWKFDDGHSIPTSQANCLGGYLDSQIFVMNNRQGEVCLLATGNCSNKIELFTLN
jgi:WD40 repeat protein